MRQFKPILAVLLTAIQAFGQQWYSSVTHPYEPKPVPPANLSNTGRVESLLRDGKLYLSLQDAIALALENNVDIAVERYIYPLAQADLLRAQSGNSTQGIPTSTSAGATGLNAAAAPSFITAFNSTTFLSAASGFGTSSNPNGFDPTINSTIDWGHISSPQQNTVTTGTTSLVTTNTVANFNVQESFVTGGYATLSYNNTFSSQNSYLNLFNPVTNAYLDLSVAQPLLQVFDRRNGNAIRRDDPCRRE